MARPKGIKWNLEGFEDLRNLPEVRDLVGELAHDIAQAASDVGGQDLHVFDEGSSDDDDNGYQVTDLVLEQGRAAFSVMAVGKAHHENREKSTLLKGVSRIAHG